jgi:hypothetical protein
MKKLLLVSLMLALVLALVVPTSVLAAKPASYDATGTFISIDEGQVKCLAYDAVNPFNTLWQVKNRHIEGVFNSNDEDGALQGPFTITYDAMVNGLQMGFFSGNLKAKSVNLKISGISYGIDLSQGFPPPLPWRITMGGIWSKDSKHNGSFTAEFCFIPTADGNHIAYLTSSSFTLDQLR